MRRKKMLTRKGRAIRLVAAALLLLFYANFACNTGYLLPIQAILEQKERIGAGKLETVEWRLDPEMEAFLYSGQICLLANSDVTALVDLSFSPLNGWRAWSETLLTEEEQTLYVGAESFRSIFPRDREPGEPWNEIVYLFGRVDDPDIRSLRMELGARREDGETLEVTADRAEWIVRDDGAYFLLWQEFDGFRIPDLQQTTAYDAAGNVVTTVAGGT